MRARRVVQACGGASVLCVAAYGCGGEGAALEEPVVAVSARTGAARPTPVDGAEIASELEDLRAAPRERARPRGREVLQVKPPPARRPSPSSSPPRTPPAEPPGDGPGREEPCDTPIAPGGGAVPPANDACPAEPVTLGAGEELRVSATTAGAADDMRSFCGVEAGSGPDLVYALRLERAGTLEIEVGAGDGSPLDAVVYLRTTCEDDATTTGCFDYNTDEIVRGHYEPGVYFVIVDGAAGSAGAFELRARLDEAACGDGVLNPEEICDDGNGSAGDGCSAACAFEAPSPAADTCPGEPLEIGDGGLVVDGHTTGFTDDLRGTCSILGGGRDRAYQIVASRDGTLEATIGLEADGVTPTCEADPMGAGCWDRVLYVRRTCDSAASADELACSDDPLDGTAAESISVPVAAGVPIWLVVDGFDDAFYSYGPFQLRVNLR